MKMAACELCDADGGEVLFRHPQYRVVRVKGVEGDDYRGFCRVIWNDHVKEMTDLNYDEQTSFMSAVFRVEHALRAALKPDKINLASLGNMTPHLHWHVIPRFQNDKTVPKPIWALAISTLEESDLRPHNSPGNQSIDFNVDWAQCVQRALLNDMPFCAQS